MLFLSIREWIIRVACRAIESNEIRWRFTTCQRELTVHVDYQSVVRTCITASILSNNSLTLWMNRNEREKNGEQHSKALLEHKHWSVYVFIFVCAFHSIDNFSFFAVFQLWVAVKWVKVFACRQRVLCCCRLSANVDFQIVFLSLNPAGYANCLFICN